MAAPAFPVNAPCRTQVTGYADHQSDVTAGHYGGIVSFAAGRYAGILRDTGNRGTAGKPTSAEQALNAVLAGGVSMRILDHQIDLRAFFHRLAETSARTLFLDYDGTLAPFAVDPREACLYPCVIPIIQRLIDSRRTRVVFVSGRRIEDLTPLLPFTPLPELWGAHGYEQLSPDGTRRMFNPGPESRDCLARVRHALSTGLVKTRYEVKTASIAVHWRGDRPVHVARIRRETAEIWRQIPRRGTVTMDEFDGGIEFKARDRTKGSAVADTLGDSAIAAYLGDDVTDEDAVPVVSRIGLAVLVRPHLRPTAAALWLSPPAELEAFLLDWETACAGQSAGYLAALPSDETAEALPWT